MSGNLRNNLKLFRTSSKCLSFLTGKNIERQISELEEKRKKNLKKMKKQNLRKERKGKKAEPEHDVILHLSPIRRTETNSNPSQSTTTATVDTSDFHSVD